MQRIQEEHQRKLTETTLAVDRDRAKREAELQEHKYRSEERVKSLQAAKLQAESVRPDPLSSLEPLAPPSPHAALFPGDLVGVGGDEEAVRGEAAADCPRTRPSQPPSSSDDTR